MMVLFDDYLNKDNVERVAAILRCTTSCTTESVMFHKINEFIFDFGVDECWGSSLTLGSSVTNYYNIPLGAELTIKRKSYPTAKIIEYLESGVNVDITFETTDELNSIQLCKSGNHVTSNLMECLNKKWVIKEYNGIQI